MPSLPGCARACPWARVLDVIPAPPLVSTVLHLSFLKMCMPLIQCQKNKRVKPSVLLQFCHCTSLKLSEM